MSTQDTSNPQATARGDFAARLAADSYFSDVTVLEQRKGVTESDIEIALATLNEKTGKIGAVAIVLMPELLPGADDAPGPEYRVRAMVQVISAALFNEGATGTGKSAEAIALRVRQLLHRYEGGFGTWSFAGMEPIDRGPGEICYGVSFTRLGRDEEDRRLSLPMFEPEGGAPPVAVTITGLPGTAIWFTTDGTYPAPANPTATLYTAPLALTEPTTIRAVAYLDNRQPSNVATATFGANYEFTDEFSNEFA